MTKTDAKMTKESPHSSYQFEQLNNGWVRAFTILLLAHSTLEYKKKGCTAGRCMSYTATNYAAACLAAIQALTLAARLMQD
jgi:hypothetical protein